MTIASPTFKPSDVTVDIANSTDVSITNLSLPDINTEVSHTLNANLKQLTIRSRSLATIKIAFTISESATKYLTLKAGAVLELNDLDFSSKIIYLQSGTITIVEIFELHT